MFKQEFEYRDRLAHLLHPAETEYRWKAGIVDIYAPRQYIELKKFPDWKSAIGQVVCHRAVIGKTNKRIPRVHLILDRDKESQVETLENIIIPICRKLEIDLSWEFERERGIGGYSVAERFFSSVSIGGIYISVVSDSSDFSRQWVCELIYPDPFRGAYSHPISMSTVSGSETYADYSTVDGVYDAAPFRMADKFPYLMKVLNLPGYIQAKGEMWNVAESEKHKEQKVVDP